MPLTDYEKQRRKERRKQREEAKRAGTYVPPRERKSKKRKDLLTGIREHHKPLDRKESRRQLKQQRATAQDRIARSTGWRPKFKEGEPVLIKARVDRIVYPLHGGAYTITLIEDFKTDSGRGWYVEERYIAPWPRRKK